ncbi:Oxidoreductase molybdopterin binding domain-containing protein [Fulvimarina manganoxydans]|uniref:Oxidoreductase molybdopterin binding domain-containing protein n=1 Tax=Fulvimarina manganoxydans TaxID=937218 RepID=A0A1W2C1P1_9HYPH|nr:molybdopterin-dependent oxidoreductase [Fulvimarina manganoxydans]SMC79155.1 Oxidoreductase molybdopterin binding domain-containing protein [Fulvimarina manganoxydans]
MTTGDGWGIGVIGNAEWTGVALRDVLGGIAIDPSTAHVAFGCADATTVAGEKTKFGISISIEKALHADTLLAWAMNGEPLSPEHGAPLHLVVPGYAGVRNAKWVETIELRSAPCEAPTQSRD